MGSYQPIIGLEVHVELKTKSKMFCSCSADYFGHKPNTHTCPVCLGLPGSLPVANRKAIEWTVLTGLALNCKIPLFSKFDRKNYFYPDLPKGYQISQYDLPLAINGSLKLKTQNSKLKTIRIRRVHLEEDTAKLIHTKDSTLIDFNRSGVPLMEIVTEPDIRSPQEATEFLKKLQQIVRYLGVSDCDMEKGSMRLEANVSVRSQESGVRSQELPDYRVEIKNLNSFRFVEKAINYEIKRQLQLIKKGKKPLQETRGWDEIKQVTYPQRWKEEAQDYRYFPEPDIPPLRWSKSQISKTAARDSFRMLKSQIGELPDKKIARLVKQFNLLKSQAVILTETRQKADYFEEVVRVGKKHKISAKEAANVIINKRVDIDKLLPAELIQILVKKKVKPIVKGKELEDVIKKVLKKNKKAREDYKKGKEAAVEFLVGQVMAETKGGADPNKARKEILRIIKINK